jgi:hypothetical protein
MIKHKEKRDQKRNVVHFPITYIYSDEPKMAHNHGTTFDLCHSGMSFYTNTPLKKGLNIRAHADVWDSAKPCIIKWLSKKTRNIYKVGVFFQKEHP